MQEAYAAGLVDGEGCILISHVKRADTYALRVAVAMVTKGTPILSVMLRQWGGRLNEMKPETERNVPKTRWAVDGEEAAAFLEAIAPHLILKQGQASLGLQLQALIRAGRAERGRHHWTQETRREAQMLKDRIHDLNRRGPQATPANPPGKVVAIYRWGTWWNPDEGLFGPTEFSGQLPTTGCMIAGRVAALPPASQTSEEHTLLPTPRANDSTGPGPHGEGGLDLPTAIRLLPTPTATDSRASGGSSPSDQTLTDVVIRTSFGAHTTPRFGGGKPSPAAERPTPETPDEMVLF